MMLKVLSKGLAMFSLSRAEVMTWNSKGYLIRYIENTILDFLVDCSSSLNKCLHFKCPYEKFGIFLTAHRHTKNQASPPQRFVRFSQMPPWRSGHVLLQTARLPRSSLHACETDHICSQPALSSCWRWRAASHPPASWWGDWKSPSWYQFHMDLNARDSTIQETMHIKRLRRQTLTYEG